VGDEIFEGAAKPVQLPDDKRDGWPISDRSISGVSA
jgi:hypothetical protein